jgi:TRAP-type C4-dicarboxylate transport system permease small subunit
MNWLSSIRRGINYLSLYVCGAGMFLLIPMMLLTTGDVIVRAGFARTIPGTVEISEYLLAAFILSGLAYAQQVKAHPRVSFIISRFSPRVQAVVEIVTTLLSLFIISIVVWQGWVIAIEERAVSDVLRIPEAPFRLFVAVGAFALSLELLIDLTTSVTKLRRG